MDKLIKTYEGHTRYVRSVFVDNGYLFSGSNDETIKQWEISTGKLVKTYEGHTGWVFSVFVDNGYLFSGSEDKTIKQWDTNIIHKLKMKQVFNSLSEFHDRPPNGNWKLGGYWFREGWNEICELN